MTDGAQHYKFPPLAKHESVDHSKGEYVRGDVHTNTLEGFFLIFKRGLVGVYQHMDERHLGRYLASLISAGTPAPSWALTTCSGPKSPYRAPRASAFPIKQLTKK